MIAPTGPLPAAARHFAAANRVAPVVITSSTRITARPPRRGPASAATAKAPARLRWRWRRLSPPWLRVARRRFLSQRSATLQLQRHSRGLAQRRAFAELKRRHAAGRVLTTLAQGWIVRNKTIPPEWRARIVAAGEAVRQRKREYRAAVALQASGRRMVAGKDFRRKRGGAVKLQTRSRTRARQRAGSVAFSRMDGTSSALRNRRAPSVGLGGAPRLLLVQF